MLSRSISTIVLIGSIIFGAITSPAWDAGDEAPIKAGLIGLDTSHVIAFTKVLNNPKAEGDLADVKVVAAYPGGSKDIPSSWDRVGKYTEQLRGMGIEIVDSIDALLEKVDVVLLESVDGRPHLAQATPVIQAGKPLFIDKPMAGSLADAIAIFELAKQHNVPVFSSSSLRFSPGILIFRTDSPVGEVIGCDAFSPCSLEPHHPDLFWYGIHGVETLFTIMGTGCEMVSRMQSPDTELVVGKWKDGRIGTFRGTRKGQHGYGAKVHGSKKVAPSGGYGGYEPLVVEIAKFFKTGKPPVSAEETLEILAFMEAADQSKKQGGCPVSLESVMRQAREAAAGKK